MATLPAPIKSERQKLLEKIPLGEFLLGPEAIRSYGTLGGMGLGSGFGPAGTVSGGYAGSVLTQALQGALPEIFGEPPIAGQLGTATEDVGGALLGKGIAKALPWTAKTAKEAAGLFTKKGHVKLLERLAEKMGPWAQSQKWKSPLAETSFEHDVPTLIKQLQKEGVQLTVPQVVPHPFLREMQQFASDTPELLAGQQTALREMGEKLLTPTSGIIDKKLGTVLVKDALGITRPAPNAKETLRLVQGKKPSIAQSMDEWAAQVEQESSAINPSNRPVQTLLEQTRELRPFQKLIENIGPDKARITLVKDALEKSFDRKTGLFNSSTLFDYYTKHRAQFNHVAQEMEKQFGTKASDLKSAWNKFIFGVGRANIGNEPANRAMEFQATNALSSVMAAIPTIGFLNYPVMRSVGLLGKVGLVGPRLGKALNDPEMLRIFTELSNLPKGSLAAMPKIQKIFKWANDKGIPFTTTEGADYFILPGNQVVPKGQAKENIQKEIQAEEEKEVENPWKN